MIDLRFDQAQAYGYTSPSQKVRVLSEHWAHCHLYCPSCGSAPIGRYGNNRPVADFFCDECGEEFELKSLSGPVGNRVADGAYRTMVDWITSNRNPNFFLMSYDRSNLSVTDLVVIPKHFFTPQIIECRNPLADTARRKGWVGCDIRIDGIPSSGRISLVRGRFVESKAGVIQAWRQTLFLREQADKNVKGWLLAIMNCIERLNKPVFSLADVYAFESHLAQAYPSNHNIKAKIRQQVQVLRDAGYIEFNGAGIYKFKIANP